MSNMKDFKSIADDMMSGIAVSERLKAQTLSKCAKKRRLVRTVLAPAAAAAVVLVCVLAVSAPQPDGEDTPNVMMATETASALMAGQERDATPEQAGEFLDGALLMPGYAPEGFTLHGIRLAEDGAYKRATITFSDGESYYVIIEETRQAASTSEGFKSADINGINGYVKSSGSAARPDTEAHWEVEGVHYAVTGSINEEEAVKIARSMK